MKSIIAMFLENGPIDCMYIHLCIRYKSSSHVNKSVVILKWGPSAMFLYLRETLMLLPLLLFYMHYPSGECGAQIHSIEPPPPPPPPPSRKLQVVAPPSL